MQDMSRESRAESDRTPRAGRWAGAALSVVLIAGVGYWTYRLGQRDAMAVPVIQAMEGPARTQPDDPKGLKTDHQGLTVTAVVERDRPKPRPEAARTAPPPEDLAEEDVAAAELPAAPAPLTRSLAPAPEVAPMLPPVARETPPVAAPVVAPVEEAVEEAVETPEPAAVVDPAPEPALAVTRLAPETAPRPAPRPASRPARAPAPAPAVASPAPVPATPAAADRRDVAFPPAGTPLIQLGAFDSPEIAQAEWQRLVRAHGDLLGTRGPLIQRTVSAGRVFFRLRAEGFEDLDDARAICTALAARGPACIPARQE